MNNKVLLNILLLFVIPFLCDMFIEYKAFFCKNIFIDFIQ